MEKVVKVSKDGASIDFFQSDKIPVSPKKFRSGPELEGFYRFIFENDLRREALAIIDRIYISRKAKKNVKASTPEVKMDPKQALKAAKAAAEAKLSPVKVKVAAPAKKAAAPAKKTAAPKPAKKAVAKKPAKKKK